MDRAGFEQMLDEQRERQLLEALDECKEKGVCKEKLLTLVFETGARWLPDEQHTRRA